jgi:hypothetical protein
MTGVDLVPMVGGTLGGCQQMVTAHHYLRSPVDVRSRPLAYHVRLMPNLGTVGCLIFGRPEASACFAGGLTYGGAEDVAAGRAAFDRWEVLNLARVWLSPRVQPGGNWHRPRFLPGFVDRRGVFRSTLASAAIGAALGRVGLDYLLAFPPCFLDQPYRIRALLSYCDTSLHKGMIYRAAGFQLARCNDDGIETWWTAEVRQLDPAEDERVRAVASRDPRGAKVRGRLKRPVASLWE